MGEATAFEPAGDQPMAERRRVPYQSRSLDECITNVTTPTGKKLILKTMLTTACERNCFYCPFRAGRSRTKRMTFTPDEVAGALDTLSREKRVDGIFLSSGIIKGSITTQDKIIDTIEIVRKRYNYEGYVHLKIMPGVEFDQLHRAMQLADRVSVNLEAIDGLAATHPGLRLVFVESGGDNLAASFSPDLVQRFIYVIDVAAGDKIPRKGGPGITRSDLLVINKTDLAPHVGASLEVMDRDARRMRGDRPIVFANVRAGVGVADVAAFIERHPEFADLVAR